MTPGFLRRIAYSLSALAAVGCLLCFPVESQAGFEWVPDAGMHSTANPEKIDKNQVLKSTAHPGEAQEKNTNAPAMKVLRAHGSTATSIDSDETIEDMSSPEPMAPMPVIQDTARNFETVMGFGRDMPLALALEQVIPGGYTFVFGPDVNAGASVSWNANGPWNKVVADMVKPLGYKLYIDGTIANIHKPGPGGMNMSQDNMISTPTPLLAGAMKENTGVTTSTMPQESVIFDNTSFWQGHKGQSVQGMLKDWALQAGVKLVWESERDFTLAHNIMVNDNFKNALMMVFRDNIIEKNPPSLTLMETPGTNTTATLVVKDQDQRS